MTATTLTPAEINTLAGGFDIDYSRRALTDAVSTDGITGFFVAAKPHRVTDVDGAIVREWVGFQVYGVELTGVHAGSVEVLMDEYRTQAEAEAIAARYARIEA